MTLPFDPATTTRVQLAKYLFAVAQELWPQDDKPGLKRDLGLEKRDPRGRSTRRYEVWRDIFSVIKHLRYPIGVGESLMGILMKLQKGNHDRSLAQNMLAYAEALHEGGSDFLWMSLPGEKFDPKWLDKHIGKIPSGESVLLTGKPKRNKSKEAAASEVSKPRKKRKKKRRVEAPLQEAAAKGGRPLKRMVKA